jgi:hypothetical protein
MAITCIRLQALHHNVTHGFQSIGRICLLVLKTNVLLPRRFEVLVDERTEELRFRTIELGRQAAYDKLTGPSIAASPMITCFARSNLPSGMSLSGEQSLHGFGAESCRCGRQVLCLCNNCPGD